MALKFQFIQTILSIMTNEVSEKTSSTVAQKITAAAMWLLEKSKPYRRLLTSFELPIALMIDLVVSLVPLSPIFPFYL